MLLHNRTVILLFRCWRVGIPYRLYIKLNTLEFSLSQDCVKDLADRLAFYLCQTQTD